MGICSSSQEIFHVRLHVYVSLLQSVGTVPRALSTVFLETSKHRLTYRLARHSEFGRIYPTTLYFIIIFFSNTSIQPFAILYRCGVSHKCRIGVQPRELFVSKVITLNWSMQIPYITKNMIITTACFILFTLYTNFFFKIINILLWKFYHLAFSGCDLNTNGTLNIHTFFGLVKFQRNCE